MATINQRRLPSALTQVVVSGTGTIEAISAPAAGYKHIIWGVALTTTSGNTIALKSGSTTLTGDLQATGILREIPGVVIKGPDSNVYSFPKFEGGTAQAINVVSAGTVAGWIEYETVLA